MNKLLTFLLLAVSLSYAVWDGNTNIIPIIRADIDTTALGNAFKTFIANHSGEGGGGDGEAFPVGAVYLNVTGTDPGTELGYGTWEQIAEGQFLVGQTDGDADFDVAEETGGAKTHSHDAHPTGDVRSGTGATAVTSGSHSTDSHVPPYFVIYVFKRTE